jgi:hypothetical protein
MLMLLMMMMSQCRSRGPKRWCFIISDYNSSSGSDNSSSSRNKEQATCLQALPQQRMFTAALLPLGTLPPPPLL